MDRAKTDVFLLLDRAITNVLLLRKAMANAPPVRQDCGFTVLFVDSLMLSLLS